MKGAPQLNEWPTFTGEGKYDHMSFIKTIEMLQEDYAIPDELITARLHSLFEKSAKRGYHGIRQTNDKNTWSWWKQEIISKWANDSWRHKIENAFKNSFFDPDKDKPLTWFLKKVERLNALYPEMSQKMVHMKILRRCGGELKHALRSSPNKPFIKKDEPRETLKPNTSNNNEQRKCHKCGGIGHLANNCLKREKINEIVETDNHNDKEEESDSEKDTEESETSESDEINIINAQIDNIDLIYEVLDINSNLPQAGTSDKSLTNIQDAKFYRTKPEKGMGYTAGKSSIGIIMVRNQEEKVSLDTGAYCTCVGKGYLKTIVPDWEDKLIPIQGVKFSSASESMKPLGIIDLTLIFPPPSQVKRKEKLIDLLFKYKDAFATAKEPLGAIIGHEVDIILNVEKPYPPLSRRPAYPASPRTREALEVHIKELMDLGVLRKVGHNEQVEVTTPVIIACHNGKSRMVGDFGALKIYTIPDRYPIPRIHETLTQLSQAKFITAMDSLKGFHQNVLKDKSKKLLRIIVHCEIFEYLRMPFGIKNAPSHYQRMMNTIFPEEFSEGWLIIYIDDIIIFSETWNSHLSILEGVLQK
ncbi:hypothetical protein O181_077692 [Austropuccinia psidii MF-1]|uniref:CCHC-type domain-containing protein n=1 Tax=Austropuccinia psidii MF-1 TaxID=1389203 RepID=A0A9Q3FJ48_9BASI|nr:hypothetical protein [Austropuccinia psidii MF-1]